ncbi:hypothetical protein T07_10002 [Trichinella nelsoni]|uniref:Uncharacterized protein n=1 Tax=Trichinella nelsoni TaxID=6336 RepID=A0A0V0SF92_9BILA|nr:hypothetical protein T07_10002 [Trichinella nelsoni]
MDSAIQERLTAKLGDGITTTKRGAESRPQEDVHPAEVRDVTSHGVLSFAPRPGEPIDAFAI